PQSEYLPGQSNFIEEENFSLLYSHQFEFYKHNSMGLYSLVSRGYGSTSGMGSRSARNEEHAANAAKSWRPWRLELKAESFMLSAVGYQLSASVVGGM